MFIKKLSAITKATLWPRTKNFVIHHSGKLAITCISIFMAPMIMIFLPPAEYGILGILNAFIQCMVAFMGTGFIDLLTRKYPHAQHKSSLVNTILGSYIVYSIPFMLLVFYAIHSQAYNLLLSNNYSHLAIAIIIICFFTFFNDLYLQLILLKNNLHLATSIQLANALVTSGSIILFLGYFKYSFAIVLWTQLCVVIVLALAALIAYIDKRYYRSWHFSSLTLADYKNTIAQAISIMPAMGIAWLFALVNRFTIANYTSLTNVWHLCNC